MESPTSGSSPDQVSGNTAALADLLKKLGFADVPSLEKFVDHRRMPRRRRRGGCVPLNAASGPQPAARHLDHPAEQPGRHRPAAVHDQPKPTHVQVLAAATGIPLGRISTLQSLGKAVGRIEVSYGDGGEGFQLAGTAWLVTPDLAVTSRHVAMQSRSGFADGIGRNPPLRTNIFGKAATVEINFGAETIGVEKIEWIENLDEDLVSPDIAFLRLKGEAQASPLELTTVCECQSVAVIQYPVVTGPENGNRTLAKPGEEHLASGQVVAFDARFRILAHTAITHGGSSGSPVIDIETSRVVGIHSGNKFGFLNCATLASVIQERLKLLGLADLAAVRSSSEGIASTDETGHDDQNQGHH